MRKTRLILIVAVIALLAVGGAYAAWTSRVTISANASAGEMDVQISSIVVGQVSEHVELKQIPYPSPKTRNQLPYPSRIYIPARRRIRRSWSRI